jgi:hypothetical protein
MVFCRPIYFSQRKFAKKVKNEVRQTHDLEEGFQTIFVHISPKIRIKLFLPPRSNFTFSKHDCGVSDEAFNISHTLTWISVSQVRNH